MKKFEVEMEIVKTYKVKIIVEGEFAGSDDQNIKNAAKSAADNMSHGFWSYQDTEFEIQNVNEIEIPKKICKICHKTIVSEPLICTTCEDMLCKENKNKS